MVTQHSLPDGKLGSTGSQGDGKAEDLESYVGTLSKDLI